MSSAVGTSIIVSTRSDNYQQQWKGKITTKNANFSGLGLWRRPRLPRWNRRRWVEVIYANYCCENNPMDHQPTLHSWLRGSMGFENYKKWTKVGACFSFNEPTKQEILHFLTWLWPKFCTKLFSPHCWKKSFAKIMVNVQKRLKRASVEADFWNGENIDILRKKL